MATQWGCFSHFHFQANAYVISAVGILYSATAFPFYLRKYVSVFTYRCLLILKMVFKIIHSVLLPKSKYFIKILFYIVFFTCTLI